MQMKGDRGELLEEFDMTADRVEAWFDRQPETATIDSTDRFMAGYGVFCGWPPAIRRARSTALR